MFAKKGEISLVTVMEMVLAIMTIIIFAIAANSINNPYQLERFGISKDVALLVDASQAVSRNIYYEYPETIYGNDLLIQDSLISVLPKTDVTTSQDLFVLSSYPYSSSTITIPSTRVNGGFFVFSKQDGKIVFSNTTLVSFDQELFQRRSGDDVSVMVEVFEPESRADKLFINRIANHLRGELRAVFPSQEEPNLFIGVYFDSSNYQNIEEDVNIYHSDLEESKQLANFLDEQLTNLGLVVYTVRGHLLFDSDQQFIELQITQKYKEKLLKSRFEFFNEEVARSIDSFYE